MTPPPQNTSLLNTYSPKSRYIWLLGAICVLVAVGIGLFFGSTSLTPQAILQSFSEDTPQARMIQMIVFDLRLPRTLAAVAAGAILATGGLVCQALLRNSLAEPYILGISGGAAVGTIISVLLGLSATMHTGFAFAGAMFVVALILLAYLRGHVSVTENLLLSGVMVNAFCGAFILFLISMARSSELSSIMSWFMGNLGATTLTQSLFLLAVVVPTILYMVYTSHRMNALVLGDITATSLGINVTRQAIIWIIILAFAVSATVSLVGPLGFIGLIVPQCAHLILGHDHRLLVPASALFGAIFLILCDLLARTVVEQGELPVGVITALIGAPTFLFLQGKRP